jgi:RHS repeat-associated protein
MPTVTTTYVIGNGNNGAGANQILSETTSGVTTAYAYDGNGNRTGRTISGTTDVFSYDYENRLTSFDYLTGSSGTGMYTYAYDYRTRRVSRTEPSAGTTYIVFDGGTSIIEYGAAGAANPSAEYIRGFNYGGGVGGLEYSVRGGVPSFNFYDSRGDVTTKTSSTGAVTWETAYEAFGNQTASTGTTPLDRQRASTKEQDPTGFLNEGFRYRDLSTGTFLTRDPLGFQAGPNMYTYVRQNPWTSFDPEGLDATQPNPPPPPPPQHHSANESSKHPNTPPKKKPAQSDQKKSSSKPKPAKSGANKSSSASGSSKTAAKKKPSVTSAAPASTTPSSGTPTKSAKSIATSGAASSQATSPQVLTVTTTVTTIISKPLVQPLIQGYENALWVPGLVLGGEAALMTKFDWMLLRIRVEEASSPPLLLF